MNLYLLIFGGRKCTKLAADIETAWAWRRARCTANGVLLAVILER